MTNFVTDPTQQKVIGTAILGRQAEVASYQLNINTFTLMLGTLPTDEWPEALAQYKGKTRDEIAAAGLSSQDQTTVTNYSLRDELTFRTATENIELQKVNCVLAALTAQIDPASLSGLLASLQTS